MFWDARFLFAFALMALLFFVSPRASPGRRCAAPGCFMGFFVFFYTFLTFLTGRGGIEVYTQEHILATLYGAFPDLRLAPTLDITVERIFFAISQFMRLFSISAMTILIPYSLSTRRSTASPSAAWVCPINSPMPWI